jgi:hypothetical protein
LVTLFAYQYAKKNWIFSLAFFYLFSAIICYFFFDFDIFPPCIWTSLWDQKCMGCGMTSAFLELLQGNFQNAWEINPFIFIVLPSISYFIIRDFRKFVIE